MGQVTAGLIEKAKAGHIELFALGALLNKEREYCELTFAELVKRYSHLDLTESLAKSACYEYELARKLNKARGGRRIGSEWGNSC
jgi:hypothetical protein|tara:strand:+ start:217 stop:471 length:255 start_codon:yes stop_codon:yes gene_type:complete